MLDTIEKIKNLNQEAGNHFFSPALLSRYDSKVYDRVYGDGFFVTSEYSKVTGRRYSVRHCCKDGTIESIGYPGGWPSLVRATAAAKAASKGRLDFRIVERCAGYWKDFQPTKVFPWTRFEDDAQSELLRLSTEQPCSLFVLVPMVRRKG